MLLLSNVIWRNFSDIFSRVDINRPLLPASVKMWPTWVRLCPHYAPALPPDQLPLSLALSNTTDPRYDTGILAPVPDPSYFLSLSEILSPWPGSGCRIRIQKTPESGFETLQVIQHLPAGTFLAAIEPFHRTTVSGKLWKVNLIFYFFPTASCSKNGVTWKEHHLDLSLMLIVTNWNL